MMFENLKRVAMNELKKLDTAYANKEEFSPEDAKKYDCLMHALKSHLTSCAMMEAENYSENENVSGRRGRNPVNGQYMSMDRGNSNTSYADGYSRGYSEAMAQNQSGYSYMYPPRPYHY